MDYGRLIKLLYLADRQSLIGSGAPITGDRMVSLDYGPVLSKILDMSQVTSSGELAEWHEYIKDEPQPRFLSVANDNRNTDELSEFELAVLGDVHDNFGHMTFMELSSYTHTLPEYQDPDGSAIPIRPERILKSAGIPDKRIREIANKAHEDIFFESLKAKAR